MGGWRKVRSEFEAAGLGLAQHPWPGDSRMRKGEEGGGRGPYTGIWKRGGEPKTDLF